MSSVQPSELDFVQSLPVSSEVLAAGHELPGPALQWMEGHVLGNGDLGAVVWGHAEQVYVGLSKHDLNDLRGPEHGAEWEITYPEMLHRVEAGDHQAHQGLHNVSPWSPRYPAPLPAGRLMLEPLRGIQAEGFHQRLSFVNAEVEVTSVPTHWGWSWGMKFAEVVTRVLVHAERNVVLVELNSELEQRVRWGYEQNPNLELSPMTYETRDFPSGCLGLASQELIYEQSFAVAIGANAHAFEVAAAEQGLQGVIEFGGEKGAAVLVLAVATERESGEAGQAARAQELLQQALSTESTDLIASHRAWWQDFWRTAQIDYSDPVVARLWYMGLYALACSTRPHTSPPHLQGIWNQYDVPPWHGDFHFNANVQECHWLPCAANHPELQAALVRVLLHDWREEERLRAQRWYKAPGLCVPFATDWLGRDISGIHGGTQLCITAWAAQHVWWQWEYTQDEELLREIYPWFKECCELYAAILVRDEQGTYNFGLTSSPEQSAAGRNASIDIATCRILFHATLEAARLLGIEDPFLETVHDMHDHLPPLPTQDGVLIDLEVGFFEEGDRPGRFPICHRHPSRLVPIFPGHDIGLHSDSETLELGRRSFAEFRSYGDEGFTGWSEGWQACLAARLGLGEEAEARLHTLTQHFLLPGMLTSHNSLDAAYGMGRQGPLFQIEALFGAAAGVNFMLLDASGGVIRVFPAVPEGRSAAFHALRAPGAHLVSARREPEGITEVVIQAGTGGQLSVANPWPGREVRLEGDETCLLSGDVLTWETGTGKEYRLAKA